MNVQFELFDRDKLSSLQMLFLSFSVFSQECILCVCVSESVYVSVYVYILSLFFLLIV